MFSRLRARLTFANVTSVIALFFAVCGTSAYAINEWTGANIQDGTLTGADVKGVNGTTSARGTNGSLTGADISGQPAIPAVGQPAVNGSIGTYDLANGGVRGLDLQADTLGGAQIKESTLGKVPDADKLDGRSADDFGRTAVAAVISYTNGGTFGQKTKVVIDAPTDGLMLVTGSASIDTLLGGNTSC